MYSESNFFFVTPTPPFLDPVCGEVLLLLLGEWFSALASSGGSPGGFKNHQCLCPISQVSIAVGLACSQVSGKDLIFCSGSIYQVPDCAGL